MKPSYDVYKNENENAEWMILIHGFCGNRKMWKRQMVFLKKQYHVLNFDLPGHGESQGIVLDKNNIILSTIDAFFEIMQEQGIKSAHFMGVSLGTVFALLMAVMHKESVIDMILCGGVIGINGMGKFLLYAGYTFKGVVPYIWLYGLIAFMLLPHDKSSLSRRLFISNAKKLGRKQFNFWLSVIISAEKSFKLSPELIINTPKLCIMGEQDNVFLKMLIKEGCEENGFKLKTIPDCGHLCNIEKANEFNEIALSFLQSTQNSIYA